jgi:hypothetical protein
MRQDVPAVSGAAELALAIWGNFAEAGLKPATRFFASSPASSSSSQSAADAFVRLPSLKNATQAAPCPHLHLIRAQG